MDNFNLKKFLAEGRLLENESVNEEEGSNPVFNEFIKLRNTKDPVDLVDFVNGLDDTDEENLRRDVEKWYINLVKGKYGDHKDYKDWEMDFIDAFSFEDWNGDFSDQSIFTDFEDYVNNI